MMPSNVAIATKSRSRKGSQLQGTGLMTGTAHASMSQYDSLEGKHGKHALSEINTALKPSTYPNASRPSERGSSSSRQWCAE